MTHRAMSNSEYEYAQLQALGCAERRSGNRQRVAYRNNPRIQTNRTTRRWDEVPAWPGVRPAPTVNNTVPGSTWTAPAQTTANPGSRQVQRIGSTYVSPGGGTSQRIGGVMFNSDGSSGTLIGNTIITR